MAQLFQKKTIAGIAADLDMQAHRAANDKFKAERLAYGETFKPTATFKSNAPSYAVFVAACFIFLGIGILIIDILTRN